MELIEGVMNIKSLGLDDESLDLIKALLERNGWVFKTKEDLLEETDFHIKYSSEDMLNWKYDDESNRKEFYQKYCNTSIDQIIEAGYNTLGEFFLCDDCVKVRNNEGEFWIKFYV